MRSGVSIILRRTAERNMFFNFVRRDLGFALGCGIAEIYTLDVYIAAVRRKLLKNLPLLPNHPGTIAFSFRCRWSQRSTYLIMRLLSVDGQHNSHLSLVQTGSFVSP